MTFINKVNLQSLLLRKFPGLTIEIRAEQFINMAIFSFLKEIIDISCKIVEYRHGAIIQLKDLKFFSYKNKKFFLPNVNRFDKFLLSFNFKKKKVDNRKIITNRFFSKKKSV